MTLTPAFEQLTGPQKQLAFNTVFKLPAQEEQAIQSAEAGNYILPYKIYSSDGRLVSTPYDGCTRFTLLTEKARYSYYYDTVEFQNRTKSVAEELQNVNYPSWRKVRFPISPALEQSTRLKFWHAVGWNVADKWWIAWVPEDGYFEINVSKDYDQSKLQRFWNVAPRKTRYVVVASDGTVLQKRGF